MSSSAQAAAAGGTVLQVTRSAGRRALSYNVPGAPQELHLDGPTLAAIFDGAITKWNDPANRQGLRPLEPPGPCRSVPVTVPTRPGPVEDLDQYLISTSPNWVTRSAVESLHIVATA